MMVNQPLWWIYHDISILTMVYKPTYNWGAPPCISHRIKRWRKVRHKEAFRRDTGELTRPMAPWRTNAGRC